MKLLWLDLETTGLDPQRSAILEVAAVLCDLASPFETSTSNASLDMVIAGQEAVGGSLICKSRLGEDRLYSLDYYVRQMHSQSGLLRECADSTTLIREAESALIHLCGDKPVVRENKIVLAGFSVHFDLGFVRFHMPDFAAYLSHQTYDASAISLFCRSIGMPKPENSQAPAHRAMADVRAAMETAKTCAKWYSPEIRCPLHYGDTEVPEEPPTEVKL